MLHPLGCDPIFAVFPVLVGPLQTLLALLPAILIGVGSMLLAAFKPGGFVRLLRFCWRQRLFFGMVVGLAVAWHSGFPARLWSGQSFRARSTSNTANHTGKVDSGEVDATAAGFVWMNQRDKTVFSSPAVAGDRVFFSTATDIGPFSTAGKGAIVCIDTHSGEQVWRYAPENYRATFSSPTVWENSVVCGEGLHQVDDARVTCLDARNGELRWELRTQSHVESTPAIADGRVFIGAGGDGFYCLAIEPDAQGKPRVLWHLDGREYPDCEASPVVSDGIVYFGLGEGGTAACAVQADTGKLLWKVSTPYPVFASPRVADGKLLIATGNGNFAQSAADLLAIKLQVMRDEGATEQLLAEASERGKPVGEVWCIDLATQVVDWKFTTGDAILGAVAVDDDALYFGSRDGHVYRLSRSGELLNKFSLHEPIVSSPALGTKHVYCSTARGRLFGLEKKSLKPVWDAPLGGGELFSSSPVLAQGHVYIGTPQQGLCCVGRPGDPELPKWVQGDRGGNADDVPVPEGPEVLWQFPPPDVSDFTVTAPLMPLEQAIYAAVRHDGRSQFLRLNVDGLQPVLAWSRKFEEPIEAAPIGCGGRVCIVEGVAKASRRKLHCLSSADGQPLWSTTIAGPPGGISPRPGIALDAQRVYAWTGEAQLRCFELATGKLLWEQSPRDAASAQDHRATWDRGAPALADDLLFAIIGPHSSAPPSLIAVDAITGIQLWAARLSKEPTGSPVVEGSQVLIPSQNGIAIHSVVDGALVRTRPASDVALKPAAPDDVGAPVTPLVSLRGRVYYATDQGRIVCLGAGPP